MLSLGSWIDKAIITFLPLSSSGHTIFSGGRDYERALHQCQSGSRGKARRGQSLYEFCASHYWRRRMAHVCFSHSDAQTHLWRHIFPARGSGKIQLHILIFLLNCQKCYSKSRKDIPMNMTVFQFEYSLHKQNNCAADLHIFLLISPKDSSIKMVIIYLCKMVSATGTTQAEKQRPWPTFSK